MASREENEKQTDPEILEKSIKVYRSGNGFFLYFIGFTASLSMISSGCGMMWTSSVIPKLRMNDSEINPIQRRVTPLEEGLIASMMIVGGLAGPLITNSFPDIYGRKKTLIVIFCLNLLSFVVMAFAKMVFLYYLCRFLIGVAFGSGIVVLMIYFSEITEEHNRGGMCSLIVFGINLGNLISFILGSYFSVETFTLLCGMPVLLGLPLLIVFMPESPVFLLKQDDYEATKLALKKLRRRPCDDISGDIKELETMLRNQPQKEGEESSFQTIIRTNNLRKGLLLAFALSFIKQFSGVCGIMGFLGPVFLQVGLSSDLASYVIGSFQITATLIACQIVDKVPRRSLFMITTSFVSLFLLALAGYFGASSLGYNLTSISWMPALCLIGYIISFNLGESPIQLVFPSEIFPDEVKSTAVTLCVLFEGLSSFVVVFSFPLIMAYLGVAWCFAFFFAVSALGVVFYYYFVPETRGRSCQEIMEILSSSGSVTNEKI